MHVESPYRNLLEAIPQHRSEGDVAGTYTVWFEYGPDRSAATPEQTMVFVHGFRGDHHGLEPIVAHLPGYRILVPDLPGFGDSSAPEDTTIGGYRDWLRAFVAEQAPGAIVLGHSFGSIVVAAAASNTDSSTLDAPRIILVNPIAQPALEGSKRLLSLATLGYYRAAARMPERAGRAVLASPLIVRGMSVLMAKTRQRSLRRWIHNQHDRYFSAFATRDAVLGAFETSISANVAQFAPDIAQPVLLIAADRDDVTPIAVQHNLRPQFANASLSVLHGVGHLVHYERPHEAASAIRRFLKST